MYYLQENGTRLYKVGSKYVEIKKNILDCMREWSSPPFDESARLDKNIVGMLLVACVGVKKLAVNDIEDDVMRFINGKPRNINCGFKPTIYTMFFYRHHDDPMQIERNPHECDRQISRRSMCKTSK